MAQRYRTIEQYLADLTETRRAEVELLREIVATATPGVREHIKWNSPSYIYNGEDRVTVNAHGKDAVRLILHAGPTTVEDKTAKPRFTGDPHGLLQWHSNIRASLSLADQSAILAQRVRISEVVRQWFEASV